MLLIAIVIAGSASLFLLHAQASTRSLPPPAPGSPTHTPTTLPYPTTTLPIAYPAVAAAVTQDYAPVLAADHQALTTPTPAAFNAQLQAHHTFDLALAGITVNDAKIQAQVSAIIAGDSALETEIAYQASSSAGPWTDATPGVSPSGAAGIAAHATTGVTTEVTPLVTSLNASG